MSQSVLFPQGIETSLVGATHAEAVGALRRTGDHVTLVVLPAGSLPPVARSAPLFSSKLTLNCTGNDVLGLIKLLL